MKDYIKTCAILSLSGFPLYIIMLAKGINILISFTCAALAITAVASIMNKVDFGR